MGQTQTKPVRENATETIQREYEALTIDDFRNGGLAKLAKKWKMSTKQLLNIIDL
jgi:2-iminoacetate synthase ThiH